MPFSQRKTSSLNLQHSVHYGLQQPRNPAKLQPNHDLLLLLFNRQTVRSLIPMISGFLRQLTLSSAMPIRWQAIVSPLSRLVTSTLAVWRYKTSAPKLHFRSTTRPQIDANKTPLWRQNNWFQSHPKVFAFCIKRLYTDTKVTRALLVLFLKKKPKPKPKKQNAKFKYSTYSAIQLLNRRFFF